MIKGDVNTLLALSSQLFQEFANPNYDTCVMSIYYYHNFWIIFLNLHNLIF